MVVLGLVVAGGLLAFRAFWTPGSDTASAPKHPFEVTNERYSFTLPDTPGVSTPPVLGYGITDATRWTVSNTSGLALVVIAMEVPNVGPSEHKLFADSAISTAADEIDGTVTLEEERAVGGQMGRYAEISGAHGVRVVGIFFGRDNTVVGITAIIRRGHSSPQEFQDVVDSFRFSASAGVS